MDAINVALAEVDQGSLDGLVAVGVGVAIGTIDAAAFAHAGIRSGMIFIRNHGGSHNPNEQMDIADFSAAARVLASTAAAKPPPGAR